MNTRYLIALLAGMLLRAVSPGADFLAEPYIQLGANPKPTARERLSIVWHTGLSAHTWELEHRSDGGAWRKAARVLSNEIRVRETPAFRVMEAQLDELKPGRRFEYRVLRDGQAVFTSNGLARPSAKAATRFAVWGDCAQGTPGQKQVADQAAKLKVDYVFITGDIVYSRGRIAEYRERFFPYYQELAKNTLFVGAVGNHDTASLKDLEKHPDAYAFYYFWKQPQAPPANAPVPQMASTDAGDIPAIRKNAGPALPAAGWFSFDYGAVHWTVLDSNAYVDWNRQDLRDWLEADLRANAQARWKIVAFHHPGFNSSKSHFADQRLRSLSDILERHKVDLVMSGHVHNYQRSFPLQFRVTSPAAEKKTEVGGEFVFDKEFDGVTRTRARYPIYIVTGAGGAKLYNPEQTTDRRSWQPFTAKFVSDVHSFTLVEAERKKLTVRQVSAEGAELDRFVLTH
jgi:acid phosphatase type 7